MSVLCVCCAQLSVTVIQAHQLPAMDIGGRCDAYVRVRLLPARKPTYTTKVQFNSLNPLFQETFTFEVSFYAVAYPLTKVI